MWLKLLLVEQDVVRLADHVDMAVAWHGVVQYDGIWTWAFCRAYVFIVLLCPINVVVPRHEDDTTLEVARVHFDFVLHHCLVLLKQQRSVPWENFPLEHHRLCSDVEEVTIFLGCDKM